MVIDEVIATGINPKRESPKTSRRVIEFQLGEGKCIEYAHTAEGIFIQDSAENRPSEVISPSTQYPSKEEQEPVSDFYAEGQM